MTELDKGFKTAAELLQKLDVAFSEDRWNDVEMLIEERDQQLKEILKPEIPPAYHDQARELLEHAQSQNKRLLEEATSRKKSAKTDLQQANSNRKSINAYQQEKGS